MTDADHTLVSDADVLAKEAAQAAANPSGANFYNVAEAAKGSLTSPDARQIEKDVLPLLKETKTGYKSTEFWGAIAAVIADVATDLSSKDKILVSVLAAVYALARGLAKSGVPTFEPND